MSAAAWFQALALAAAVAWLAGCSAGGHCTGDDILTAAECPGDDADDPERQLFDAVNAYRADHGLVNIPPAPSLDRVGNRHARDLEHNVGELSHSWSDCDFDANDSTTWPCMWQAPQRLKTRYPGNGYEDAYGDGSGKATPSGALAGWQSSAPHNDVILNQGQWTTSTWRALGVGIYEGYAVVWFGEDVDPASP